MGRSTKLTPEVREKILEATLVGSTDRMLCEYAGITEATFYRWMQQGELGRPLYREFREELLRARARCSVLDLATISKASRGTRVTYPDVIIDHPDGRRETRPGRTEEKPGDWRAAAWRLERRDPDNFGARVTAKHVGDDAGGPVRIDVDLRGVPLHELRRIAWDAEAEDSAGAIRTPDDTKTH